MQRILLTLTCSIFINLSFGQELDNIRSFEKSILKTFPNLRDLTISDKEDEAYFTAQSPTGNLSVIMCMKRINDEWQEPIIASFSGKFHDLEPYFSPDGLKLFFASNRPRGNESLAKDYDIWYVVRKEKDASWSDPVNIGEPINSESNEFYPAVSSTGSLYFTSDNTVDSKGSDDIYYSKWSEKGYDTPVSLSDSINSEGYEFNAYIAPDESFIIFSGYNRTDGQGSGDLYISYFKNGQWTTAKNLRHINSPQMDYCPFINNGKLYFTSRRSALTNQEFTSTQQLLESFNQYSNGQSRIYFTEF